MSAPSNVEYFVLRYVPNILSDEGISIAAVFIDPTDLDQGICLMSFASDWQAKVRSSSPDADVEMLEAILTEIKRSVAL
jgi:Protein of unknown function (DUF3037)